MINSESQNLINAALASFMFSFLKATHKSIINLNVFNKLNARLTRGHALPCGRQAVNQGAKAEGNGNLIKWNKVLEVADSSNLQDPHRWG